MANATTTAADQADVTVSTPDVANPEQPSPEDLVAQGQPAVDTSEDPVLVEAAAGLSDPDAVAVEEDESEPERDYVAEFKAIVSSIDRSTWIGIAVFVILVIIAISLFI